MPTKHQSVHNKNPKVYFNQYLDNINEPDDYITDDYMPPELLAEMLENNFNVKTRIRKLAKIMRENNHYNRLV
jgi:hypothetical protein